MKLTPHEEKILKIVKNNPKVVDHPALREKVAKKYGLTEKTLRNRIAELRKRGCPKINFQIRDITCGLWSWKQR